MTDTERCKNVEEILRLDKADSKDWSERFYWPQSLNHFPVFASFEDFCNYLITTGTAQEGGIIKIVIRAGSKVDVCTPIQVKRNGVKLRIEGEYGDGDKTPPTLIGGASCHSIFQCGGRNSHLFLSNLFLIHTCQEPNKKDIGAVIFALYKV